MSKVFLFLYLLSVFDRCFKLCVSFNRAEKTEVLSDDLLQVNMTFSSYEMNLYHEVTTCTGFRVAAVTDGP